ncbi:MAG: hypothetical protein DRP85_09045, partial [Candidatus Makaraimicrobium thalassicum]
KKHKKKKKKKKRRRCAMNYRELLTKAKSTNRKGSGLRQHIREVLSEVPKEVRNELQGQPIGVWTRFLKLALTEKYESHRNDKNLYCKIRTNLISWPGAFEVSSEGVRYLGW